MYECLRCGYSSNLKTNIIRHLKRKRICKATLLDVDRSILLDELTTKSARKNRKNASVIQMSSKSNPSVIQMSSKRHPNVIRKMEHFSKPVSKNKQMLSSNNEPYDYEKVDKNPEKLNNFGSKLNNFTPKLNNFDDKLNNLNHYLCRFCNKPFKYRQGRHKHEKYRCNIAKLKDVQITILENEVETLRKRLDENKTTVHMTNSNNTSTNTNSHNTINNIININGIGKEKVEYLLPFVKKNLNRFIRLEPEYFAEYIKHKHFNPAHPENHNVKCTNKKENQIMVWNEEEQCFELNKKKNTSFKLYKNLMTDIDTFVSEFMKSKHKHSYKNAYRVLDNQQNAIIEYEDKLKNHQTCEDYVISVKVLEDIVKTISLAVYNETKRVHNIE